MSKWEKNQTNDQITRNLKLSAQWSYVSTSQVEKLNKDLASAKNHMEQQASIIKRFKRKLLLTSKERDSFKGVLESYEHELTFTGGQVGSQKPCLYFLTHYCPFENTWKSSKFRVMHSKVWLQIALSINYDGRKAVILCGLPSSQSLKNQNSTLFQIP